VQIVVESSLEEGAAMEGGIELMVPVRRYVIVQAHRVIILERSLGGKMESLGANHLGVVLKIRKLSLGRGHG
jgi:hypothetical protein